MTHYSECTCKFEEGAMSLKITRDPDCPVHKTPISECSGDFQGVHVSIGELEDDAEIN